MEKNTTTYHQIEQKSHALHMKHQMWHSKIPNE